MRADEAREHSAQVEPLGARGLGREQPAPGAGGDQVGALREQLAIRPRAHIVVACEGKIVGIVERAILEHDAHPDLGVLPYQIVEGVILIARGAPAGADRHRIECLELEPLPLAEWIVGDVPRRSVAQVHLRAGVELGMQRIAEQQVGVGRARPVFEARFVLGSGRIGIDPAPEPVEERPALGG